MGFPLTATKHISLHFLRIHWKFYLLSKVIVIVVMLVGAD